VKKEEEKSHVQLKINCFYFDYLFIYRFHFILCTTCL